MRSCRIASYTTPADFFAAAMCSDLAFRDVSCDWVQFTIGQDTHENLRRLQALLGREIPDGDPGAIFDRAMTLLLEKVENKKLGATTKPRPRAVIRPGTDRPSSRDAPRAVKRVVWRRDAASAPK